MTSTQKYTGLFSLLVAGALLTGCAGLPKHISTTTRIINPPPGKALINFHRPTKYGGAALYPIFDGTGKFICDLPGESVYQYVCDPGKHVFIGWADQVTLMETEVDAHKIYDVMVDVGMGWVQANIRMTPLSKDDPRRARLAEFESREKNIVVMQRDDHVIQYEQKNQARVQQIKSDFLGGAKSERTRSLQRDDCR